MSRNAKSPNIRIFPKIWVLRLLCLLNTVFSGLNKQLILPPEPGKVFVFGVCPAPTFASFAPKIFDRIFYEGTDPDNFGFNDPAPDQVEVRTRYNLLHRVSGYLPLSEDWLFSELLPYCADTLPGIVYAEELIQRSCKRLGFNQLSTMAGETAFRFKAAALADIETDNLASLANNPEPIHLVLLLALFHQQKWHHPDADRTKLYRDFCFRGIRNFIARPEFDRDPTALSVRESVRNVFMQIVRQIGRSGHRSLAEGCFDAYPTPAFCLNFNRYADAEECLTFKNAIPFDALLSDARDPGKNSYCTNLLAGPLDCTGALNDVVAACRLSDRHWRDYKQDETKLVVKSKDIKTKSAPHTVSRNTDFLSNLISGFS